MPTGLPFLLEQDFTTALDTPELRSRFGWLENQFRRPPSQRCFEQVCKNRVSQEGEQQEHKPELCRLREGAGSVTYLAVHMQYGLVALKVSKTSRGGG